MKKLYYHIADEIFERHPDYMRGVVVFHQLKNCLSPNELVEMLRKEERAIGDKITLDTIAEHPHIKPWREAYRKFGAKPSEYRCSIEALARRALRNEPLPSIHALVDIGNILSLRHLVPVGSHAIDVLTQDIALRFATGNEVFVPFGSDEQENPLPGEVIFTEGDIVLTRRWTWRQAKHTLTLLETHSLEFNIDGLSPMTEEKIEQICVELTELVKRFCGGEAYYRILSRKNPRMCLTETEG